MSSQVVHLKHIGNVTFSENRRSKNIRISVKPDNSVLVSYPLYVSSHEVVSFVLKHKDWIKNQQNKMNERRTSIDPESILKTKLHTIHFIKSDKLHAQKKGTEVKIFLPDFSSEISIEFTEGILTEIYRFEAKSLLPVRLKEIAQKHGFQFNKVSIRNNRRNWGSCSPKNNISLNLQMMKLPDELIDYILLHELVHTEIKNHSPKFWERLNEVSENKAKALARQIKQYSTYTL